MAILFFAISCSAVAQSASENVDKTFVEPGLFRSDYLGIRLSFPANWTIAPPGRRLDPTRMGAELNRSGLVSREQSEADRGNTHRLLAIVNAKEQKNGWAPQIILIAEGIHPDPLIRTAKDYVDNTVRLFRGVPQPKTTIERYVHDVTIDGQVFSAFESSRENMVQRFYACVRKDFFVSFIVSGADQDQLEEADQILQKVSLNLK